MSLAAAIAVALPPGTDEADLERRFGGLRRLYGEAGYTRLRAARVAVVVPPEARSSTSSSARCEAIPGR